MGLALSEPGWQFPLPSPVSPREHLLAGFVQKTPSWTLAAHQDVLLQRLLMEHPVAHAEGRVTWRRTQCQRAGLTSMVIDSVRSLLVHLLPSPHVPSPEHGCVVKEQV